MAIARLDVAPTLIQAIRTGAAQLFTSALSGDMALIDATAPTWQNLTGCAVQADGSLKKTATTTGYDAGATSTQTIAAGDGFVIFMANVPQSDPAIPYVEFSDRVFMAGLTTLASVTNHTQIDFGIEVSNEGVRIFEGGVERGVFRAARNNGLYQIGIESGQVVYRADGDIIYRSGQTFTYPLRFGAVLWFPADRIGGQPATPLAWTTLGQPGQGNGSFNNPAVASPIWFAPANRGQVVITARTTNNVFGSAIANVQEIFPGLDQGMPIPGKSRELVKTWPVKEEVYKDDAADSVVQGDEPIRRWLVEFSGRTLTVAQAATFDAFYERHKSGAYPFFYKYERVGETAIIWNNVRFEKYDADHRRLYARQQRTMRLIRRPL